MYENIFNLFLLLYPQDYRKRFGEEMQIVFKDMCSEELEKKGKLGLVFWLSQIWDITQSVIEQHIDDMRTKGMKKYLQQTLHFNKYNIVSLVFLLPVILMTGIEIISRILQRDLAHYNRPLYAFFSHTFLYWTPILFIWVIIFPLLAVVISSIPLVKLLLKNKKLVFNLNFEIKNIIGIMILIFGLGFVMLIRLHDFVPCVMHGLFIVGIGQLGHILSFCRNA